MARTVVFDKLASYEIRITAVPGVGGATLSVFYSVTATLTGEGYTRMLQPTLTPTQQTRINNIAADVETAIRNAEGL